MFRGGFYDEFEAGFPMHPALERHLRNAQAANTNQRFEARYRCYSVTMMPGSERENVNFGGKCILPPSALDKLTRLNISYPMLFELRNESVADKVSHLGVLEFIAEEGRIYLPNWMMKNLDLDQGDLLHVLSTEVPLGRFVQLQPQSVDFLDISDPKAVLENTLRNFSTLTKGDIFQFLYNDKVFEVAVLEVKPESSSNSVCVVETDLEVDFAAPVGYVPPEPTPKRPGVPAKGGKINTQAGMAARIDYQALAASSSVKAAAHRPFAGAGAKLSGKEVVEPAIPLESAVHKKTPSFSSQRNDVAPAPLRVPFGTLFFGYDFKPPPETSEEAGAENAHAGPSFAGAGQKLRTKKARNSSTKDGADKGKAKAGASDDPIEIG